MFESIIDRQIKEASPLIFLTPRKFILSELISFEIFIGRVINVITLGMFGINKQLGLNLKHKAKLDV